MRYVGILLLLSLAVTGAKRATPRRLQCESIPVATCAAHQKALLDAKKSIMSAVRLVDHDSAGFDRYDTPVSRFWIPDGSSRSEMLPLSLAEQAVATYGDGGQTVRRGDIVLDCGANVGVFTRLALDHGAARVIAIEPAPENLESLRRNFAAEIQSGRVQVVPMGVWDKAGSLTLHVDPLNSGADSFVTDQKGSFGLGNVPVITIDRLVEYMQLDRVDFIKMDIEGAEPRALRGAVQTIKQWKPRISVAAYHHADHPLLIQKVILQARPDYVVECGPCEDARVKGRASVIWFR